MNNLLRKVFMPEDRAGLLPSILAIAIGLLAGFVFLLISRPENALAGLTVILTGGARNIRIFGDVLFYATPIMLTGLSFAFANKTGLFNIGMSGQFIIGSYASIVVGVRLTQLGDFMGGHLHWIVAVLAGMAAGAVWGSLPGLLKAFFNVNEVISCIMLNYIGMFLVNYLIPVTGVYNVATNQSANIAATATIPRAGLDQIFVLGTGRPAAVDGGFIIAVVIAVILFIVLEKTTFGYELRACGLNRDAARYAGINEKKSIVLSMLIAGGASGVGGALTHLSSAGLRIDVVDVLAYQGFNGIPVALLAMSSPIGVIFSAIFVAYLRVSGFSAEMRVLGFAPEIYEIIVSIIIYFSAFALIFGSILLKRRLQKKQGKGQAK